MRKPLPHLLQVLLLVLLLSLCVGQLLGGGQTAGVKVITVGRLGGVGLGVGLANYQGRRGGGGVWGR